MRTFTVAVYVTGSVDYVVDAKNAQEAIQKARKMADAETDQGLKERLGQLEVTDVMITDVRQKAMAS